MRCISSYLGSRSKTIQAHLPSCAALRTPPGQLESYPPASHEPSHMPFSLTYFLSHDSATYAIFPVLALPACWICNSLSCSPQVSAPHCRSKSSQTWPPIPRIDHLLE